MQPIRAQSGNDLRRIALIVELARMTCGMHIAIPNGTTLPATREAGLVQIANAHIEPRAKEQIWSMRLLRFLSARLWTLVW